jgi:hypothetical protein
MRSVGQVTVMDHFVGKPERSVALYHAGFHQDRSRGPLDQRERYCRKQFRHVFGMTAPASPVTEIDHRPISVSALKGGTSDTRVIISASQIKKPAMITRVSGVIRPEGLGDLRSPV